MSWTNERVELLEKLWKEGKSAAEIAKELGGVTRNAVIGKAHRLGLSGRPQTPKKETVKATAAKKTPEKTSAAAAPARMVVETAEKPENGLTILDLNDRVCKWPIGDPRDENFYFCGERSRPGTPYCDRHAAMAYQTPGRRQDEDKAARKEKESAAA